MGYSPALLFSRCVILSVQIASEDLSFLIHEMGMFGFSKWDALTPFRTVSPLPHAPAPALGAFGSMLF